MRQITRSLVLLSSCLALTCMFLAGCGGYVLQGKVVQGSYSDVQLVYAGDERLNERAIEGVDIRVSRDPDTLNRHLVGRARSSASGEFTIIMNEFGTGWMQEQWLIEAVRSGYGNASTLMQLPGKNSKWRLLVTLAPGSATPVQDDDQIMQDLEKFR